MGGGGCFSAWGAHNWNIDQRPVFIPLSANDVVFQLMLIANTRQVCAAAGTGERLLFALSCIPPC